MRVNRNSIEDNRNYSRVHKWLAYHYGKAKKCENQKCPKESSFYTWSLKRGELYEQKRSIFWQLCASCHSKYDFTEEGRQKLRLSRLGKSLPTSVRRAISKKMKGVPRPQEVREKISKSSMGKQVPWLWQTVEQYRLDGSFVKSFRSLKEVRDVLGFRESSISACALGLSHTSNGFKWKYPQTA